MATHRPTTKHLATIVLLAIVAMPLSIGFAMLILLRRYLRHSRTTLLNTLDQKRPRIEGLFVNEADPLSTPAAAILESPIQRAIAFVLVRALLLFGGVLTFGVVRLYLSVFFPSLRSANRSGHSGQAELATTFPKEATYTGIDIEYFDDPFVVDPSAGVLLT